MINRIIYAAFILLCFGQSEAQNTITSNDEIVIRRKAIGLVKDLEYKYNQLLGADSEDRNIMIDNMTLPTDGNISTFVNDQVIIEDDFQTRENKSNDIPAKKVDIYFKELCSSYGKQDNGDFANESKNVQFSNIMTSKIMAVSADAPLFIKIFFDVNYTGIDKRTSLPFKQPSKRVAEIAISKVKNSWSLAIYTIRFLKLVEEDFSKNVKVEKVTITQDLQSVLAEIDQNIYSKAIISSNVNTARVYIDTKEVGYLSNGKFEYGLKPGFYKFNLKLDKYEDASIEAVIRPDTVIVLNMPMASKNSLVSFKIEPNDATVILNNNPIGAGSFSTEIPKGRYELLIDKKGYKPEKTIINLIQNETTLSFQIEKINATVELFSNPIGSFVSNNADTLGKTPLTVSLDYGRHTLVFSKKDYLNRQLIIDVTESGLQRHDILLALKPEVIVGKEISKLRRKSITNFLVYGALAYGGYYGYQYFGKKVTDFDAKTSSGDLDLLKTGKIASLSIGGIFALSSLINLGKTFSYNKEKLMRKHLEENTKIGFMPIKKGAVLSLNYNF